MPQPDLERNDNEMACPPSPKLGGAVAGRATRVFRRDGYLLVPGASNAAEVSALSGEIERRDIHGVFLSYRPGWAKPTAPVAEWPAELIEQVPARYRSLVTGLNDGF